jgi:poly(hydroxyalkanoate) depolymerase family esterase
VFRALLPSALKGRAPVLHVPRLPVPTVRRSPGRWVRGRAVQPGGRSYDVYLPAGHRVRARVPVVVLLHGCTQTPADFADATRFTTVADRNGFLLVLPLQESRHHPQRCWRWYEAAHQRRGTGEPAVLAGIVAQVLAEQERWRADPRRVHVAGLSAGGAMALILAATYPDVFAGAGVHSAPPYRSAIRGSQALAAMAARIPVPPPPGDAAPLPPLVVVQGGADRVVHAANGDRVADQWLAFQGARDPADPGRVTRSRSDEGHAGRGWTRTRWYTVRGRRVLEYWWVDGLGHAWSGGRSGGSFSDPEGPRAATVMWAFFRSQRLERAAAGSRAAGM